MTDVSFNPDWPRGCPKRESRSVPVADLLLWRQTLRVVSAALYDMDYPDLGDECWQLAAEIEATANPEEE